MKVIHETCLSLTMGRIHMLQFTISPVVDQHIASQYWTASVNWRLLVKENIPKKGKLQELKRNQSEDLFILF